jgi:hypothetical protein
VCGAAHLAPRGWSTSRARSGCPDRDESVLRPAGVGRGRTRDHHLTGPIGDRLVHVFDAAPLGRQDEQRLPIGTTEQAGESASESASEPLERVEDEIESELEFVPVVEARLQDVLHDELAEVWVLGGGELPERGPRHVCDFL